ncbi:MAG: fimbrillin family protein [Bacteroidales bacterium]
MDILDENPTQLAELSINPFYKSSGIDLNRDFTNFGYLPEGSEMGVFVHNLSSDKCVPNLRWKAFGKEDRQIWSNINADGDPVSFYLTNQFSRLYTYYPYTNNPDDLIVNHTDSDKAGYLPLLKVKPGYTDYLVGAGESLVSSKNPATGIVKNHFMSRLQFKTEKMNGYAGEGVINSLIIKNQITEAWVSLSKGVYIPFSSMPYVESDVQVNVTDQQNISVLAIPQSSGGNSNSYFQVVIDGKEHNVPIPFNEFDGYIWDRGKRYIYRFKLNPNGDVTAVISDFEFGGDWDSVFDNPKVVVNPSGNMVALSRPTPYWDDYAQSKKFEIASVDLSAQMSWYDGAGWIRNGGSVSGLTPGTTGCHSYNENGADWRIPTYHELQYIYKLKQEGKLDVSSITPLSGTYWSGNWIQNKNRATYWNMSNGTTGDASPSLGFKIRCVRDI